FLRDNLKQDPDFIRKHLHDICASLQAHLIGMLLSRLKEASDITGIHDIAIAGGVSANKGLRAKLTEMAATEKWNVFIPAMEYCTDNAAMIAMAAHHKFLKQEFSDLSVTPMARMPF